MSERIRSAKVAEITGLSYRWVQKMAPYIPSAVQFGRTWTFRGDAVRAWIRRKEEETWQKATSTAAGRAKSGGVSSASRMTDIDKAYEELLRTKRRSGSRTGKT